MINLVVITFVRYYTATEHKSHGRDLQVYMGFCVFAGKTTL